MIEQAKKYTINQAIEYAKNKLGMTWDGNRQRLSFYEYVNDYMLQHSFVPLQDKLQQFKKIGYYAVRLVFGEDVGCDDLDINTYERNINVIATPVGCVGEARIMFIGKLKQFLLDDFDKTPKILTNPPIEKDYKESGWDIWGTAIGVETILKGNFGLNTTKSIKKVRE